VHRSGLTQGWVRFVVSVVSTSVTDGGARVDWLWGMTVRRWRAQWRLVVAVLSATILASTLVTALGLVVSTTEQSGVSAALGELSTEQARVAVTLRNPAGTVVSTVDATAAAVSDVLGPTATVEVSAVVVTAILDTSLGFSAYLAEGVSGVDLVSGEWPTSPATVAAPSSSELAVGDILTMGDVAVTVVGTYAVDDARSEFWRGDFLRGAGVGTDEATRVVGPLLFAPGGVDAAGLEPSVVRVFVDPDLSATSVAQLEPLITRLDAAGIDVPRDLRAVAGSRSYDSRLDEAVQSVASGLIVTRSTVIVVSLLLLVLAVAAIAQAARLLVDAREPESDLMRSRGAARRQVLALAASEALALGAVTAALSPPLAALAYRGFAATPLGTSAGVPAVAHLTPITWLTAAVVSLVFVGILVAPAVARELATDDETKARGPQVARTGIDIALLVVAVLAYLQLRLYESPVDSSTSLGVDPILVAGPAIALLAGAFASMRLLGPVARLINLAGSRSNGIVLPLVSWEIGRRSQRSAAAVLLLSLSLAVGTFSISFLSTWQQSQVDQAELAVGAPVRALDEPGDAAASPVLRTSGRLGGDDTAGSAPGSAAQVLGLAAGARDLLDRGRLAELGGATIASELDAAVVPSSGLDLTSTELAATVRIGTTPHPEATAAVTAILEDGSGVLHAVAWGEVPIDGLEHAVSATVGAEPARLVGVTVTFAAGNGSGQAENIAVALTDLGVEPGGEASAWYLITPDGSSRQVSTPDDGSLLAEATVPGVSGPQASTLALVGWQPAEVVPAIIPTAAATTQKLEIGDRLTLVVNGSPVRIEVAGTTEVVPGSATFTRVRSGDVGVTPAVVVDHTLLQRALAASGETGDFVDEWWVDAAPGTGGAFVASHDDAVSSEALALALQESPLRVATPVTLWTAIAAGGLLAAIGFLMHTTMSLRSRRLELAQLGAIGVARGRLRLLVTAEALVVGALGAVFGAAIGVLLALLIGPLVAASPTGEPPVPAVVVALPWGQFLLLDLCVALVLAAVVSGVARGRAFVHPAELLRGARE